MVEYLKIVYVRGQQVLDGRGNPTLEATVTVRNCVNGEMTEGRAIVPNGTDPDLRECEAEEAGRTDRGEREAAESFETEREEFGVEKAQDGELRICTEAVKTAAWNIEKYLQEPLAGTEVTDQRRIDHILREIGSRENQAEDQAGLENNALLAVSLACADAAAKALHTPLYRYLGGVQGQGMPIPMMNVIDGGVHAANSLDVQEFMIVPVGAGSISEGIAWCCDIYHTLKKILFDRGLATSVGDEGGFAPNLSTEMEAINFIMEAILRAGFEPGKDVCIGLDVAADTWKGSGNGEYCMPKQKRCYSSRELIQEWEDLVEKYPVFSLEDPLGAEDLEGWRELTRRLGDKTLLVGDDLFSDAFHADTSFAGTSSVDGQERLWRNIHEGCGNAVLNRSGKSGILSETGGCGNAVLIQPGKIGTLTEMIEAVQLAREQGYRTILSHRSGESEDSFIADLAVALNTGLIKTGAPSRGERTAKYNQLLRIEEELTCISRQHFLEGK